MLNISEEDKKFLRRHIHDADKFINQDTRGPLLLELEGAIVYKGLDKDGFYNKFGCDAQLVYDRILENN